MLNELPYLDTNDSYYHSFVENFQEEKLKRNQKPQVEIIIDQMDRNSRKVNSQKQLLINEAKKKMRTTRAKKNLTGTFSDDEKSDIF